MHRDASGVWHANVTVFGAWSACIGYTLDWLMKAPARFSPRRRMIEWGLPWFSLVDVELPVAEHRAVPIALHVAAVTGTTGSGEIEAHLFACADAVIFHADTLRISQPRVTDARLVLERWIEARGEAAVVVYQLDTLDVPSVVYDDSQGVRIEERPPVRLEATAMCSQLAIGTRPYVETNASISQLGTLYRETIRELLAERERLGPRPRYA